MSCRSTAAGSALTTYARLQSGLTDVQTLSAYHALRAEGRRTPAPSQEQWQAHIENMRQQVHADTSLTDARRQSLLGRLDRAAQERPDGATWHAVRNIVDRAARQQAVVESRLRVAAQELGVEYDTVLRRYRSYQDEIDRTRSHRLPAGYIDEEARAARAAGLPEDRGSVAAMRRIDEEVARAQAERAAARPQRIERRPMDSSTIAEAGYDPDGGRLEVVFHRNGGVSRVYAYTGVPASVWQEMQTGSAGQVYNARVRNRREYRYESLAAADLDGVARQCPDCGQFASSSHACPVRQQRAAEAARAEAERAEQARLEQARQAWAVTMQERAERMAAQAAEYEAREAAREAAQAAAPEPAPAPQERPEPRPYWSSTRYRYAGSTSALGQLNNETGAYDRLGLPRNLTEMRQAAASGPITFGVGYAGSYRYREMEGLPVGRFSVSGTAVYDRPARGQHTVEIHDPRCGCPQYQQNGDCPHINYAVERLRLAMLPPSSRGAGALSADPEEQARQIAQVRQRAEEAMRQDWMRNEQTAVEARARWAAAERPEDLYSANFAAFEADYQAALARKAAGEEPVPYMTENALGGLADHGSGRGFGVELEFDLEPGVDRYSALAAIGRELHEAGLTQTPQQQGYHSAERRGYTDNHQGGWSYERDGTVSGEIVSPVMYDTPETWQNLAKVCEIVRRNGGVATVRTGSHVHVSSPNTTPATATELVRMANQHEDVLYRVTANPERGTHRKLEWCGPNRDVPVEGYETVVSALRGNNSHHVGVNLQSVRGESSDHAEIRHPDGSLNPAVIQAQIKMSVAMVAAAERNGTVSGPVTRGREPIGSHAVRLDAVRGRSRRALTSEELQDDSATARSFADTLFHRREDKAQFAALFAVTKWMRSR